MNRKHILSDIEEWQNIMFNDLGHLARNIRKNEKIFMRNIKFSFTKR